VKQPLYGEPVITALRFLWAVQGTPCGRLLAAGLPDLVPRLRRFKELNIDDATAALLLKISPVTIDRPLAADRAKLMLRGRSHTKPGSLLKDSIPMRTWAQWDEGCRGSWRSTWLVMKAAIVLASSVSRWTLPILRLAGPRPCRLRIKPRSGFLLQLRKPLPRSRFQSWASIVITVLSSSIGSFSAGANNTSSPSPGPGQAIKMMVPMLSEKNWHIVRQIVGYHRYDTTGELDLLNQIWALQRLLTNDFAPQQKLVSKTHIRTKIIKKYDAPKTPFQRVLDDSDTVRKSVKTQLAHQNKPLNPAAIQRQIQALTEQLLSLTTSKKSSKPKPPRRALSNDSTNQSTRAS
jgi:hypothetical protein